MYNGLCESVNEEGVNGTLCPGVNHVGKVFFALCHLRERAEMELAVFHQRWPIRFSRSEEIAPVVVMSGLYLSSAKSGASVEE